MGAWTPQNDVWEIAYKHQGRVAIFVRFWSIGGDWPYKLGGKASANKCHDASDRESE